MTGKLDAFMRILNIYQWQLKKLEENKIPTVEKDTVLEELKAKNLDMFKALYFLAFESYNYFNNF